LGNSGATITFYTGKLGSGKTIAMVIDAFLAYYGGSILLSNMKELKLKNFYFRVDDALALMDMLNPERKYTFILDEASGEADNRDFFSLKNKKFSKFISQARKRNIDVIYASPWISSVEKRLRELTDYIVRCKAIRDPNDDNPKTNLIGLYYRKYDVEEERMKRYYISAQTAKFFYKYYNTKEFIEDTSGVMLES